MAPAMGKNAKKRAARSAFYNDPDAKGDMPFALHVIITTDGKPRRITFASLTSFKEYREEFYASKAKGELRLLDPGNDTVKETGKAYRSKVVNRGADHSNAKPKPLVKGDVTLPSVKGRRFRSEGFQTDPQDVNDSWARDSARKHLIAGGTIRLLPYYALKDIREKYRTI